MSPPSPSWRQSAPRCPHNWRRCSATSGATRRSRHKSCRCGEKCVESACTPRAHDTCALLSLSSSLLPTPAPAYYACG
eukprot:62563-Chlamydomonas_euryale.AAC.1